MRASAATCCDRLGCAGSHLKQIIRSYEVKRVASWYCGALREGLSRTVRSSSMEHLFSALAFAGLIAAQFLAVVFAANQHCKFRSSNSASSEDGLQNRKMQLSS
jgi:hypothetical protein